MAQGRHSLSIATFHTLQLRRQVAQVIALAVAILVGIAAVGAAAQLALLRYPNTSGPRLTSLLLLGIIIWFFIYISVDLQRKTPVSGIWQDLSGMLTTVSQWGGIILLSLLVIGVEPFKMLFAGMLVALSIPCRVAVRVLSARITRWLGVRTRSRLLIIGAGQIATFVVASLLKYEDASVTVVGFVDDMVGFADDQDVLHRRHRTFDLPIYRMADIPSLIEDKQVDHVVFAFSPVPDSKLIEAMRLCQRYADVRVDLVPRFFEAMSFRPKLLDAHGLPLVRLSAHRRRFELVAKRIFDALLAILALIVLFPLLLVAAVAIRLEGPGPILFRQRRVGRHGTLFTMYKLRSMREPRPGEAVDAPSRYTRVGAFLRNWGIDELPQLWNVLWGSMSLVGPRPEREDYVELFSEQIPDYQRRHRMRGGLTGLAQIKGLRGDTSIVERTRLDHFYVDNWTFWLDLKIMLFTLGALIPRSQGIGGASMFLDLVTEVIEYRTHTAVPTAPDVQPTNASQETAS